jgi:hypothetical protein
MGILNERGNKCQHCGDLISKASDITLHHTIELTPDNYRDANISLNPYNIMVVHKQCHNKLHNRYQYAISNERLVYLVYGPPLSGKSTYVQDRMQEGDLVVDMDRLYLAVSGLPMYNKPNNLLPNVRSMHSLLLDNIRTRFGKWNNAFIIGGYADKYRREQVANDLDAELVFCDVGIDECFRRLDADPARREMRADWIEYINRWFREYKP